MSHFLHLCSEILTVIFLMGVIGCLGTLLMTFWEDLLTISGHEERALEKKASFSGSPAPHSSPQ